MMDIYDKYKNKGLTGLSNLGNTCYLNSCMQILSHCYDLNNILDKLDVNKLNKIDDSILLIEWINLKNLMWSKNCIISPNRYVNTIQNISNKKNIELFSGFAQNDLPEFLVFLIDCFHNSLKRKFEMNISGKCINKKDELAISCFNMIKSMYSDSYSEILNIFYGIQISFLYSEDNNNILSSKPEPYCLLDLPIPINKNVCDIFECFDLYVDCENLSGDNAWYNEKTKQKENVNKCFKFWSLPEILIVSFKKFNNYNKKINILVNTPINNLDLSKYVIGYDNKSYKYDLFGICNHSGNSLGGHYTSYVKNANNKWYIFNDTSVSEIKLNNIITNKGYCYFYKKIVN